MAGMRDMIIHKYFAVNLEVVWETVHEDIPRARKQVQEILDEGPENPS